MSNEADDSAILTEASEASDREDDNLTETTDDNGQTSNNLKQKLDTFETVLRKEIHNIQEEREKYKMKLNETVQTFIESIQSQKNNFYEKIDEFYSKKRIKLENSLLDVQPLQKLSLSLNQGIVDHINDMVHHFIDKTQHQINRKIEFKQTSVLNKGSIGYLKEINFERRIFQQTFVLDKIPKKIAFIGGRIYVLEDDRIIDVENEKCVVESEDTILNICRGRINNLSFLKYVDGAYKYVEMTKKGKKPKERKLFQSAFPSDDVLLSSLEDELIIMDLNSMKYYLYDLNKKIIERFELDETSDFINIKGAHDCFYATTNTSIFSFDCLGIANRLTATQINYTPSLFSMVMKKLLEGEDIIKGGDLLYVIKRRIEHEKEIEMGEEENSFEEIIAVDEDALFPKKVYHGHYNLSESQIKFILSDKDEPRNLYSEIYAIN